MVHDVKMGDVVQKEASDPAQEVAIKRSDGAASIGPGAAAVVRQFRVGVMQVGERYDPVIHKAPRNDVEFDNACDSVCASAEVEGVQCCKDPSVRYQHRIALRTAKDNRIS